MSRGLARAALAVPDTAVNESASVLHNADEAPDGSQAVVLANWTSNAQRVTLTWRSQSSTIDLQPWEVHCEVRPKGVPASTST